MAMATSTPAPEIQAESSTTPARDSQRPNIHATSQAQTSTIPAHDVQSSIAPTAAMSPQQQPQQQHPPPPAGPPGPPGAPGAQYHYYNGPAPPLPVTATQRSTMSIWWPMGMLIAWIVLAALGGGLMGGAIAEPTCTNGPDGYGDRCGYDGQQMSMFWGGIACVGLAAACFITFWVLLVVYLVRRSNGRAMQPVTVVYVNANPPFPPGPAPGAGPAPGVASWYPGWTSHLPQMYPASQPQQPQQDPEMAMAGALPRQADTQDEKACGSCGARTATPFCPQCGTKMQ